MRNEETLKKIKKGDILIIKSSFPKGKGHKISCTRLKLVGKVESIKNQKDYECEVEMFQPLKNPVLFKSVQVEKGGLFHGAKR